MGFKPSHIIVLLIILILVFGASKLPEIAKNIGKSAKVLKKEMKELTEDGEEGSKDSPKAEEKGE
ncbi:MAG: twin-arginine translocase TatA/TatE family subunit [Actinomycetaceae bacterium]|nr:twin-arginine translocase TatA/TatE family subunit [Actinomycetaceae bacterium]